jgi:hypothetical protein
VDFIRAYDSITYANGPEGLCNDSVNFNLDFTTIGGGTGGISQFITLPTWQSAYGVGLSGDFTSTTNRNLPDVSLFASSGFWGHFLLFCDSASGPCDYAVGADAQAQGVGGTSAVAPMLTGIIGLINQRWPSGNGQPTRQGQADYTLYALATAEFGTPTAENTSTTAPSAYTCEGSNINAISTYGSIFPNCTFYAINRTSQVGSSSCVGGTNTGCLVGNNGGACVANPESPDCYINTPGDTYGILSESTTTFESAFSQSAGYSAATGLGSVNIANLVDNWTSFTPLFPSTTTVGLSSASIFTTTSTDLTATVTATGRGGIAPPLGTVSFYSGASCTGTAIASASLVPASACTTSCNSTASSSITGAQIGASTTSVVACFSGDGANDATSASSAATVSVTQTALTVTPTPTSVSIVGGQTGTVSLAVSANAAISTALTFSCTGLPSDASCTFTSVANLPSSTSVTMTINTTTSDAKLIRPAHGSSLLMLGLMLPGLLLVPAGAGVVRRRKMWLLIGLVLLLTLSWAACGGGPSSNNNNNTAPTSQNYTVNVSGSATGATAGTTSVTVTVTGS